MKKNIFKLRNYLINCFIYFIKEQLVQWTLFFQEKPKSFKNKLICTRNCHK